MLTIESHTLHRLKVKLIIISTIISVAITGWIISAYWVFRYERKMDVQRESYESVQRWYRENSVPMRK